MAGYLLSLTDIYLSFGGDALLEGANLDVSAGDRIALVGRNGSGKSTLLKIAAGFIEPDKGERFLHPGITVRYLAQEPEFAGYEFAEDYIRDALNDEKDHHRIEIISDALGVDPQTPLATCSGGEAKRIAIAAAIISDPDILLLDEPTNHLDLSAILDLEKRIGAMKAAVVLISHDRRFLETLTTKTVWLDRGKARAMDRGFRFFEEWRDETLEAEKTALHKLGRKIATEEDWVRYGVTARRKRNMRRLGELHAMRKELRDAKRPVGSVKFEAATADPSGKDVIVADNVSKTFGERKIVADFSVKIRRGERIGIVGPNGAGKTTLLKLLTGQLDPDGGTVTLGANINLISLDQLRATLKPELRLADAIADERGDWVTINGAKRHVATYLQDFLFSADQWRAPVSSLSGGERGRLALAAALAKPSNLLCLDEPTNDLDLETLDLLEELLASYEGTLLLISHDRSFLDHIVTAVITTDPDREGGWRRYPGGYDDMIAQRGRAPGARAKEKAQREAKTKTETAAPKPVAQTKLSYKEKYALETLPDKIAALEKEITALKSALADPKLFERNPKDFSVKAAALEKAEADLAEAEHQWLEIELKREHLEG